MEGRMRRLRFLLLSPWQLQWGKEENKGCVHEHSCDVSGYAGSCRGCEIPQCDSHMHTYKHHTLHTCVLYTDVNTFPSASTMPRQRSNHKGTHSCTSGWQWRKTAQRDSTKTEPWLHMTNESSLALRNYTWLQTPSCVSRGTVIRIRLYIWCPYLCWEN